MDKDKRIDELLAANNRFEQRGRMAESMCRLLEKGLLVGVFGETLKEMVSIAVARYREDFPKRGNQ